MWISTAGLARARGPALGDGGHDAAWALGSSFTRDWAIETAIAALETQPPAESILMRRELEVLRLIARGRSNTEALFISVRIVKSHVTNIFT